MLGAAFRVRVLSPTLAHVVSIMFGQRVLIRNVQVQLRQSGTGAQEYSNPV